MLIINLIYLSFYDLDFKITAILSNATESQIFTLEVDNDQLLAITDKLIHLSDNHSIITHGDSVDNDLPQLGIVQTTLIFNEPEITKIKGILFNKV